MQRLGIFISICALVAMHILSLRAATSASNLQLIEEETSIILPSPIQRITALEYRGLASDFLFLKALVFIGSTMERTIYPRVKTWEWRWLYFVFDASSNLDPYFFDPYYLANATIPWSGNFIVETNTLLERGSKFRDWDWMIPFFIGFNKFYFLQDSDSASKHLMESSRRPGASPVIASIASKLAFKANKTENSILFLEEILSRTEDRQLRKEYGTRIEALQAILFLEKAVKKYREQYGKPPRSINDLTAKRIVSAVPVDPYGGAYFIDQEGKVQTTSKELTLHVPPKQ